MARIRGRVEPEVTVAAVADQVDEGADARFTVTRTGVTTGAPTVSYSVSETGDMVASGEEGAKTVAFADGDTEQTVTVPTVEDSVHEADSTVTLTLTADAAYELGTDATAEVTVEDDDAPTVTVSAAPVSPATANDYTLSANRVLTVAAGATTSIGAVTVTGVDNDVEAPDRRVTVSATATNGQGVTAPRMARTGACSTRRCGWTPSSATPRPCRHGAAPSPPTVRSRPTAARPGSIASEGDWSLPTSCR